jgi:hypothetical protein
MDLRRKNLKEELLIFLDIPNTIYTLDNIEKILKKKLRFNKNTSELTLTNEFKQFFNIKDDKININSLVMIISLSYINNITPLINHYEYYQKPVQISTI